MSALERVLLAAAALFPLGAGLGLLALAAGWDPVPLKNTLDRVALERRLESALLGTAATALGLAGLSGAATRPKEPETLVRDTELGAVRISLPAVKNLVHRAARQTQGIRDVRVRLAGAREGLLVDLSLHVAPDLNVPRIAEEVQRRVESYLRETVGLKVQGVSVRVQGVGPESRAARVE